MIEADLNWSDEDQWWVDRVHDLGENYDSYSFEEIFSYNSYYNACGLKENMNFGMWFFLQKKPTTRIKDVESKRTQIN